MTNYELVKKIESAKSYSRGTSLVTINIPNLDNNTLNLWINKLNQELCTATNIKSKNTRKDVITSLKSAIYTLKNINTKGFDNGIVLCSGITDPIYCL